MRSADERPTLARRLEAGALALRCIAGGEDGGDPSAVEFGHITGPHGRSFWRALDAGLMPDPAAVLAGEYHVRREPETGADWWTERKPRKLFSRLPRRNPSSGLACRCLDPQSEIKYFLLCTRKATLACNASEFARQLPVTLVVTRRDDPFRFSHHWFSPGARTCL